MERDSFHTRIHALVGRIPRGRVMTYGWIASHVEGATARMVGYALASLPDHVHIPWHRVVNARGEVSVRTTGAGHLEQRRLLEAEGVVFDDASRMDLSRAAWRP